MKVLHFSRDYSPHDERFLNALGQTPHEVLFLRLSPTHEITLPAGIREVKFAKPLGGVDCVESELVEELDHILNTIKPDVLHAGPLNGPAYYAALSQFSPLASMSWGFDMLHDAEVNPTDKEKIQKALQRSTVFIADCKAVAEKAVNEYNFAAEHIFRFPWGVDLKHFSPAQNSVLRNRLGWQKNFVFLSNRSFEEIYGVDVMLRAFIAAAKQAPEIRLLMYGKGSLEGEIRHMARTAGVIDKIHFGGYLSREELPESYHAADVFLSASHCDGSSVSLLEALACGKPALVSDIPGNLEWVRHKENGWVFQDGNEHALTALMLNASRATNLAELGKASRRMVEEHADWQHNFAILTQAYEKAQELHASKNGDHND